MILQNPILSIYPVEMNTGPQKFVYKYSEQHYSNSQKNCKGIQCLATEGCINKIWSVHTMKYYLSTKKNVTDCMLRFSHFKDGSSPQAVLYVQ